MARQYPKLCLRAPACSATHSNKFGRYCDCNAGLGARVTSVTHQWRHSFCKASAVVRSSAGADHRWACDSAKAKVAPYAVSYRERDSRVLFHLRLLSSCRPLRPGRRLRFLALATAALCRRAMGSANAEKITNEQRQQDVSTNQRGRWQ